MSNTDGALNYEADLHIDIDALEVEWMNQPALFMRYSKQLAEARDIFAQDSEKEDVLRAELASDIRKRPTVYEMEKVTEGSLNETVTRCLAVNDFGMPTRDKEAIDIIKRFRAAHTMALDGKNNVDLLEAAVRAFNQRKDALENLVRLHAQNYFAGPSVPHEVGREFIAKVEDRKNAVVREKIAKSLRRK